MPTMSAPQESRFGAVKAAEFCEPSRHGGTDSWGLGTKAVRKFLADSIEARAVIFAAIVSSDADRWPRFLVRKGVDWPKVMAGEACSELGY